MDLSFDSKYKIQKNILFFSFEQETKNCRYWTLNIDQLNWVDDSLNYIDECTKKSA